MEETEISGIYAVKVGKLWVVKEYDGYNLKDTPKSLVGFKEALTAAEETGGIIYQFTPAPLIDEQLETLKLAAKVNNE